MKNEKLSRRKSREAAFLIMFEYLFRQENPLKIAEEAHVSHELEFDEYSVEIAKGAVENLEKIDALIQKNLKGWTFERISRVSLAVLRCCIYEFYIGKTVDAEISINEAVELMKKYSDPEDAGFVNGVLGTIERGEESGGGKNDD